MAIRSMSVLGPPLGRGLSGCTITAADQRDVGRLGVSDTSAASSHRTDSSAAATPDPVTACRSRAGAVLAYTQRADGTRAAPGSPMMRAHSSSYLAGNRLLSPRALTSPQVSCDLRKRLAPRGVALSARPRRVRSGSASRHRAAPVAAIAHDERRSHGRATRRGSGQFALTESGGASATGESSRSLARSHRMKAEASPLSGLASSRRRT